MSDQGIRILVIVPDGENSPTIGVVPSVRVLDEMMSRIAFDDETSPESILPCKYFDLIVGSGDGGWIALMLGRLGMSARRAKSVYEDIHTYIHRDCATLDPPAKAAEFELRLKKFISEETKQNDSDLVTLQESKTTEPRCKVAVLTKAALNIGAPLLLRTYRVRDNQTENCPIWAAIRACTARPKVFPEFHLGEQPLISASLGHNNPIDSATHEAQKAFPNARIDCIVSLGSGYPGHSELQPASLDSLAKAAMELAQSSELVSQEFTKRWHAGARKDAYFRFSVQQGLQSFVQADYTSALTHTRAYLENPSVGDALDAAISALQGERQNDLRATLPLTAVDNSTSEIIHGSNAPPIQTYVYALYEEGFGLPLWDPQPLYKAKPVEIGDVGILTKLGAFQVLFNATLPAALQATMGYRIPPDFEPISILSSDVELDPQILKVPFLAHGDIVPSSHGLDSGTTAKRPMQRPFNLSFVAVNGAALVINDRPIEVTLTPERRIEQYIMKNCRSWYHYYEHDSQGPQRNLRGSSFVFVTSVVQNSHWALGAWSSPGKPIEVSYSGSATTGDGKFLNISGCWAPPGRRDVMQGPAVERGDPRPRLRTYGDSENLLAPLTQTLFVRGYVIGARDTRPETLEPSKVYPIIYNSWGEFLRKIFSYGIPAILRAAAEPKDLPPPPPPPTAPAVAVDESSSGEDSVELETRELSPPRQLRHPADDIMDTMFKIDPSLGIIVLHDDIVVDLMHCNENPQREIASQSLSRSLEVAKGSGTQTSHGPHPGRQGSLNLPYDLLLHIFSICDARTIGKLRLCSREFHELSTDQAVWLKILERTCSDLNLPLPSFPRSAMSSPDIELLATAWIRFQSLLRTVKDGKPPPHKIIRRIDTKGVIYAFKASSDGRFLFIVHRKGLGVWDLQTPSPTLAGCFEFEIPNARSPILRITLETNNSFLVYANIESPSGKFDEFFAFRFTFSSSDLGDTHLDLLSRLDLLLFEADKWNDFCTIPTVPFLAISFLHHHGRINYVLWDPTSDSCAQWAADINDISTDTAVFIVGEFIVAVDNPSQAMVIYIRPEIPPKSSYAPKMCAELSNPAVLYVPPETTRNNDLEESKMGWRATCPNRGYLPANHDCSVSIYSTNSGDTLLELVELFHTDSSSSTFAPLPLKCERRWYSDCLPIYEDDGVADIDLDQNLLLHSLAKESTVVFHLSSLNENGEGVELQRGILYDSDDEFQIRKYHLCPSAGRLCLLGPEGIEIVDFVESPYLKDNQTVQQGGKCIPISEIFEDRPKRPRRSSFSTLSQSHGRSGRTRRNSFH